ncbi:histidine phosphatase family protein [Kocuria kalidii]|uniref:histidine phosphatase family protein n=1 Tax=Kocuria kalidii TaxID=3376283 RepID=UPI0037ABC86D
MRLLLIRHGQTPCNVSGELDTAMPGAPLTLLGRAQARAVPAALGHERITGIHASPLLRTQLTATPLAEARGLEVQIRPGLEEISAGTLEGRADPDAHHAYISCLVAWILGDLDRPMPGGPDGHDFLGRFDAAVQQIVQDHDPADTVAVFSHGAAIRVYTALRGGLDAVEAEQLEIMNTGAAVLENRTGGGWGVVAWHRDPLGGPSLEDRAAEDVTGESAEEVLDETAEDAGEGTPRRTP